MLIIYSIYKRLVVEVLLKKNNVPKTCAFFATWIR